MRLRSRAELVALAALAYVPFLLSSPGKVSADSKQDLYLDPGRFLERAALLWDPHVGAGTVPHQNLGYLFPMGPWFWVLDRLGVPDWVAQRLWLGTLSFAAVLGARWLFRQLGTGSAASLAGALVYLLTPYQLAFTARMSVLLLPWAALPWLVGLVMRATRTRDWRAPALVAVVLLLAGGVNASSLLLVLVAPALWVLLELGRNGDAARRAIAASGRILVLGAGISLWWLAGLRLQAAHGLPVLQLTENVRTVAEMSTPGDLLRGLGNWFFYGRDRIGFSIDQAAAYASNDAVIVASYLVPTAALAATFVLRWAHRAYFGLLVVVGTVVGVGAWPIEDPTPYGRAWEAFTSETSIGLALRNSPRVVPVVVLGLAGLLAGALEALPAPRWRGIGASAVAAAAIAGLVPVAQHGFLTEGMQRPERLPEHWLEAAADLAATDDGTRVLEIPGSSFAAYRWGTTVDPVTPGLVDRPYLAREVLPAGTVGTVNLLDALDRRMQQGWFEPASLAPVARLLAVGTVVLRADLDRSGRFDTPDPLPLWRALTRSPVGLREQGRYGPPGGDGGDASLPSVATFGVEDARPIVRVAPVGGAVLLEGDGDGIVDAAAAGLLDGSALVLQAAALDDAALARALDSGAHLVLTDSSRRRAQTWFYSLRDTRGPTERAGEHEPDPTGYDVRLEPFASATDDHRAVVRQLGGTVEATAGGGPERPEHRAAKAVDGRYETAWRVGGTDPRGATLTLELDAPVRTSEVRLVQAPGVQGERSLARVAVAIDDEAPVVVELGPASRGAPGQAVTFAERDVRRVRVTVVETLPPAPSPWGATSVGLAEVRVGDARIEETVRLPVDLAERAGADATGRGLDVVLTRLRLDLPGTDRQDDETLLDRTFRLPDPRSFALAGSARSRDGGGAAAPNGAVCRDDLLTVDGAPVPVRLLPGDDRVRIESCGAVDLRPGEHRLVAADGQRTGLDVDRIVLASGPDGRPTAVGPRGAVSAPAAAGLDVRTRGASGYAVEVETDGVPFWLVLGQSRSRGWELRAQGASVGAATLVDGYANGWLVSPDGPGPVSISLRWAPQRLVWVGFLLSGLTALVVAGVLVRARARPVDLAPTLVEVPSLAWRVAPASWASSTWRRTVGAGTATAGALGLLVAPVEVAALSVVLFAGAHLGRRAPVALAAVAAGALLASRGAHRPSLAWVALLLLAGGLVAARGPGVSRRDRR